MTILRKSNYKMDVAQMMVDKGFYAPSVHSSYYSALLLVKHILCNSLLISYSTQKVNSNGKDSHKYMMECLRNDLHKKSAQDENRFLMRFNALRKNRRKADYLVDSINKSFADQCLSDSTKLRGELANIYKISV